ncbi:MAG: deoxynucleoside kinase [Bacteroidetes bacterium]|nr:deoxynucleoside kinase [Bacteroidota bacterium]MCK6609886.1 deoxynucleoside kinase [Bacteroidia bacterium]
MHLAIAGNIGSGKTTLTTLLAKHYKYEPHYENVEDNPYISDFYEDMQRWSFNMQIYFLNTRYNSILQIQKGKKNVIQDRTIYEDANIFAPNLHSMGLMSSRDFETYQRLFESMVQTVKAPDLLIYLRASIPSLVNNIQKRGREYEDSIRLDYLRRLNERYEAWITSYRGKHIIIEVDDLNFAENSEHLGSIISKIEAETNGLF